MRSRLFCVCAIILQLYVPSQDLVDAMQTYDLHLPLPLLHEDLEGSELYGVNTAISTFSATVSYVHVSTGRAVPPSRPLVMPISGKRLPGTCIVYDRFSGVFLGVL